jgi:hypothetical protein
MLVCDECGRPDALTVTIRAGSGNFVKDLCDQHLKGLLANTRAPRRGRPKARAGEKSTSSASRARATAGGRKKRSGRKPSTRKAASASR